MSRLSRLFRSLLFDAGGRQDVPSAHSSISAPATPTIPPPSIPPLLADQLRIIPPDGPRVIVDIGAHYGHTTKEYLDRYPWARVLAFEPDAANFAKAAEVLAAYGERVRLIKAAVSSAGGEATLHVNSHDGTHSLLAIGEQRYWAGYANEIDQKSVECVTLDAVAQAQGLDHIDILKMDIQGGELEALRGAEHLLRRHAISLVTLEVEFQALYRDQPLFWEIGAYLQSFGYGFYRLYDTQYHARNDNVLCWADAIFLSPAFLEVPEWDRV
jgi:FkbM family methyltransferase